MNNFLNTLASELEVIIEKMVSNVIIKFERIKDGFDDFKPEMENLVSQAKPHWWGNFPKDKLDFLAGGLSESVISNLCYALGVSTEGGLGDYEFNDAREVLSCAIIREAMQRNSDLHFFVKCLVDAHRIVRERACERQDRLIKRLGL